VVAEWLNAAVLKTAEPRKGSVSSNLTHAADGWISLPPVRRCDIWGADGYRTFATADPPRLLLTVTVLGLDPEKLKEPS
jgi:hypothetical protein